MNQIIIVSISYQNASVKKLFSRDVYYLHYLSYSQIEADYYLYSEKTYDINRATIK